MKFTAAVVSAICAIGAAAAPTAAPAPSQLPFSVIATRSDTPIHLKPLNAAGGYFWVGGSPSTYCPTGTGNPCPRGNQTVWSNPYGLDVIAPGGQGLYVAPSGALAFTHAHSVEVPAGSEIGPFVNDEGFYSTSAFGAHGFMACPNDAAHPVNWQVYAAVPNATVPTKNSADCIGFIAQAFNYTGPVPAYEYI